MILKPLPQPHLPLLDAKGQVSGVWREYFESADRLLRALNGIEASATFNPANLADGDGETTTVAVVGAAVGNAVAVTFSLPLQGVTLSAWVSATNVASVRFQNESGVAVNLAEGTLRVRVIKA